MKLPVGIIRDKDIEDLFSKSIEYHQNIFFQTLAEYDPNVLFFDWRSLYMSIDEIINIPFELPKKDKNTFLNCDYCKFDKADFIEFFSIVRLIENQFGTEVSNRYKELALMSYAINKSYESNGIFNFLGYGLNLSSTKNSREFFASRRIYYLTILNLIPRISSGSKKVHHLDLLNFLQYILDSCLIGITTSYYNLLLNECLSDFEIYSDGQIAKANFEYSHLEGFFMEPERLSLIDQLELRREFINPSNLLSKSSNKVTSFSEVANTMILFESAFSKYKIVSLPAFKDINNFLKDITQYLFNDFDIIIDEYEFDKISKKFSSLELYNDSSDYFIILNNYSPFQKFNGKFYSTVLLLIRFIYKTLSYSLQKNRTFQIHSGYVFEDKVSEVLTKYGFLNTGITRINHKEFDVVTIKNKKVYNFQCKNNIIDIAKVNNDYKKIGRLNRYLCDYYEKSLIKEKNREDLIKGKTGIDDIEHFLVSRFPVITRNEKIINFKNLENWLSIHNSKI